MNRAVPDAPPKQSAANQTKLAVSGDPKRILTDQFGLPDFRDGQISVIERLLAGKNVAAVFPTGGGKSLCYQLPSQMLEGTTVVVSPLIALMKDQCDALAQRGIKAARLDSSLSPQDFRDAMQGIRDGSIKLVYVSPERFFNERFLATVDSMRVSLFAIDEAHCISQWGHNFRPDYLKLAELSKELGADRVLALTATATPSVLRDIQDAFQIDDEDAIRTKFHRPNLTLASQVVDSADHYDRLLSQLQSRPRGSTLVYVTLQKTAEEIADRLTSDGLPAVAYHAGFQAEERAAIQEDFIGSKDGIVVATIAFGMGIDKPDIRYVYHYNAPKSLESYAQEIGRAGRDGKASVCEILLNPDDRIVLENFVYGDTPSRHNVGRFVELMVGQADHFHVSHYKLSFETDIRILVLRTLITYLELDGYIKTTSPRYDSYKIKPLVTSKSILNHFKGEPREFASNLLACLTKGRTWFTLNTVLAARKLNCDRTRIIKAIEYMSEKQWLEIKVSDLVHGYRWLRRPGTESVCDAKTLADDLHHRLVAREKSETQRMDGIFDLAKARSCQAAALSKHFGESLPQPCGICSACLGDGPHSIPPAVPRKIGSSALRVIQDLTKRYPDHFHEARDQARFLCGLSSPAMIRAKLTRHESFGICNSIPYPEVLAALRDA